MLTPDSSGSGIPKYYYSPPLRRWPRVVRLAFPGRCGAEAVRDSHATSWGHRNYAGLAGGRRLAQGLWRMMGVSKLRGRVTKGMLAKFVALALLTEPTVAQQQTHVANLLVVSERLMQTAPLVGGLNRSMQHTR